MIHVYDKYKTVRLSFEESEHKYTDSFGNSYTSCTTLLHKYAPEFDKAYWLRRKSKETGLSEADIAKNWKDITDESCARGSKTHNYLEDGVKDVSKFAQAIRYITNLKSGQMTTVADLGDIHDYVVPLDIELFKANTGGRYPEIYKVFKYYTDNGYKIYAEIGIFLPEYLVSGTIDVLCIREDQFVILDYKTNKDGLKFESGYYRRDKSQKPWQLTNDWVSKKETLKAPVSHLSNCNGSIYSLQLSMYATMVNLVTGLPCAGLGLCHIGTPFIKNEYGMPKRNIKGMYIIDEKGSETVKWYPIKFYHNECMQILNDHKLNIGAANINKQFKLAM